MKERRYECQDKAEAYRRKYVESSHSYRRLFSATSSRHAPIPIEEEIKMHKELNKQFLPKYENEQLNQQINVDSEQTSKNEIQVKTLRKNNK